MGFQLTPFRDIPLDDDLLELLIEEHETETLGRLSRLWNYYRNPLSEPDEQGRTRGASGQRVGLPRRLTHPPLDVMTATGSFTGSREVVIENDIAWRIHTLVDFMFPSPPRLISRAADPKRRAEIEMLMGAIIEANGGTMLWQDAALLGSVFGQVDFLVSCDGLRALAGMKNNTERAGGAGRPGNAPSKPSFTEKAARIASLISIETVEAPRAIPLLNPRDYRKIDAYILHYEQPVHGVEPAGMLGKIGRLLRTGKRGTGGVGDRATVTVTEILSKTHRQRYEDEQLVAETINRLGRIPVVHIQNLSQPLRYAGLSEVEPLVALQDELNTRLSDRANRVTMQSFRMWLGKGVDGFLDRPVGPGQMWLTDNPAATIESFGGDASSPSEEAHITELRAALDKASGVNPAAAGHLQNRVGNLTSENALRVSLMGTVAKTKRKRVTYGAGIRQLCDLILQGLDAYGVYRTDPQERGVDVVWADPMPPDETRRIQDALAKAELGIPKALLRKELGYEEEVAGDG